MIYARAKFGTLSLLAVLVSCKTAGTGATVRDEDSGSPGVAAEEGGTISILVIPPAANLSWASPNALFMASAASKLIGTTFTKSIFGSTKKAAFPHPIGHLHVQMDCANGVSIPLTGQTGGGTEYASLLDGVGASFRIFPGRLDVTADAMPDVNLRKQSGKIATMRFKISAAMCKHMAGFVAEYRRRGAEKLYGGQFRPRRFEGSGCSAFGLAFVELGAFMKRSEYTEKFSQNVNIGLGRISNVGGHMTDQSLAQKGTADYKYGSNLISYDGIGAFSKWPKDQPVVVMADPTGAIRPMSGWMKEWNDDRDASTNQMPGKQPNMIPWTIYDPQLVYEWIQSVYAAGGGASLGRTWTTAKDGNSNVIETDALDAVPQPYYDPTDDLRKDPDYDHPDATDPDAAAAPVMAPQD